MAVFPACQIVLCLTIFYGRDYLVVNLVTSNSAAPYAVKRPVGVFSHVYSRLHSTHSVT